MPHRERKDQVPFRNHRKGPREELKRQQNRNRNSEEGLQSGGEGKERLGDGSRPR